LLAPSKLLLSPTAKVVANLRIISIDLKYKVDFISNIQVSIKNKNTGME